MRRAVSLRGMRIGARSFFFILAMLSSAVLAGSLHAFLTDTKIKPPPTSGPYAYSPPYGTFMPSEPGFLGVGQSYADPVFGTTIRRLTTFYPKTGPSFLYVRNGFWNANGTRFLVDNSDAGSAWSVIDATNGAVVRARVPGTNEVSFDPVDANIYYYFSGASLRQYNITTGMDTLVKTFGSTLGTLGGSVDFISESGRYFLLNIGGVYRVWDKQADSLYSGSVSVNLGAGWIGIAPDGSGLVVANGDFTWYAINHNTRTVDTRGFVFLNKSFNLSDHADIITASDGNTYLVRNEADFGPGIAAANVRTGAEKLILKFDDWANGVHVSGIPRGRFRDWVVVSTFAVSGDSLSHPDPVSNWKRYRNEILMVNVLQSTEASPILRRLAHHRSRSEGSQYCNIPRASVNWDGTGVMFASSYGVYNGGCGYADIYSVEIPQVDLPDSTPPAPPTNLRIQP